MQKKKKGKSPVSWPKPCVYGVFLLSQVKTNCKCQHQSKCWLHHVGASVWPFCLCSSNKVWNSQACNHPVWSGWFMMAEKTNKNTGLLEWPKREPSAFVWALQCIHAWAYADLCLHWSAIPIMQEYARESIDSPTLPPSRQQRAHHFQHLHLADPNWIRCSGEAVMKQTVRGKRGSMCFSRLADSNLALQHCREPWSGGGGEAVIRRNNDNPRLHRQQKYSVYGEREINPLQRTDSTESGF